MNVRSIAVMNWRNKVKQKLVEYKGGKCSRCGYSKPIWGAYDFHHRDPDQKDFGLSGKSWSFDKLKEEVDKCDLLCRTCHAEVHWELEQESREERLKLRRELLLNIQCKACGKEFHPNSKRRRYCSESCAKKSQRKVVWPTLEILKSEIGTMSWVALGKKYGVCDNTVKKWARNYGILAG